MTNINWDEKPEWADGHAEVGKSPRYVWFNNNSYSCTNDPSVLFNFKSDNFSFTHLRKKQYPPKEWSGEGLPPVGTEVEIRTTTVKWHSVRYLICGYTPNRSYVFIYDLTNDDPEIYYLNNIEFRPIKSDKEKWVDQAMDIYHACTSVSVPDSMGDLYDAMQSGKLPNIKVTK